MLRFLPGAPFAQARAMAARPSVLCTLFLMLLVPPAVAQSTTEDGIRAALRGDYLSASRILRPLADDAARPDPVAQFFLAILYDTGQGVQRDMQRACALFLRSAGAAHPFAEQAAALAANLRMQFGDGASTMCVAEEGWRGGPLQTFTLGPNHRIVFADTTVRVFDGDNEQATNIHVSPGPGFLPIVYSPLDVTSPRPVRRHFFQWLQWLPDSPGKPASWTLAWTLTEVVGTQWVFIAHEKGLAEVKGAAPPLAYEVAKVVGLKVNVRGEAELAVGGLAPRTETIPFKGDSAAAAMPPDDRQIDLAPLPSVQAAVGEGVAAMARGEYQRAAALLEPLARDLRAENVAAQFFMAGLYENGGGVPLDQLRACSLYVRALNGFGKPFGQQAEALFRRYLERGRDFEQECQALARVGFDSGFEPATFTLGPGHSLEWTLSALTITYQGQTRRQETGLNQPGMRFLPMRHTTLRTGPAGAALRHFVDALVWQPSSGLVGPWILQWHVFEIVADRIVRVDVPNGLATVDGEAPPPQEEFDARQYAAIRVDESGNAEWAVLKGDHAGEQRIETEDERKEIRDETMARDAALKKVDWKRQADVNRPPSGSYADAEGCGWLQVYGWSADHTEAIVVRVSGPQPATFVQPGTFDLARDNAMISASIHVYPSPQRQFDFCSDVKLILPDELAPHTWHAVAGTMTVDLSPPGVRARSPHLRRATVTLTNVVLRNAAGQTVRIAGPVRLSALVGSFSG